MFGLGVWNGLRYSVLADNMMFGLKGIIGFWVR